LARRSEDTSIRKVVHGEGGPNEASGSVLDEIVREALRQMLMIVLPARRRTCRLRDSRFRSR